MGPGHFEMSHGIGWMGMWGYPILMIAFILIVVYIVFGRKTGRKSLNGADQNPNFSGGPESTLELLKKRYAENNERSYEGDPTREIT